jgi:hypothetical protein
MTDVAPPELHVLSVYAWKDFNPSKASNIVFFLCELLDYEFYCAYENANLPELLPLNPWRILQLLHSLQSLLTHTLVWSLLRFIEHSDP